MLEQAIIAENEPSAASAAWRGEKRTSSTVKITLSPPLTQKSPERGINHQRRGH
jgi:hypothetical protein